MRYRVTLEVQIEAHNATAARDNIQKLADVLNKKDPNNKAWVPKVTEGIRDIEFRLNAFLAFGEMLDGGYVEDDEFHYRYEMVGHDIYQKRKSEGSLMSFRKFLKLGYNFKEVEKDK